MFPNTVCVLSVVFDGLVCAFLDDDSPQDDDAAAKAQNPSLTRETDLVVLISDLENIFDEDEEELRVRNILRIPACLKSVPFSFPLYTKM